MKRNCRIMLGAIAAGSIAVVTAAPCFAGIVPALPPVAAVELPPPNVKPVAAVELVPVAAREAPYYETAALLFPQSSLPEKNAAAVVVANGDAAPVETPAYVPVVHPQGAKREDFDPQMY